MMGEKTEMHPNFGTRGVRRSLDIPTDPVFPGFGGPKQRQKQPQVLRLRFASLRMTE
jgi:hypothetical protein